MNAKRATVLSADARKRALAAIEQAKAFLHEPPGQLPEVHDTAALLDLMRAEGRRIERAANALVLALLVDDYVPVELLRAWASVRRFREWRDDPAVRLDVIVRHGRCCVRPSSFLKHWSSLPNEPKRRASRLPKPRPSR